ncbi:response regulator transcription factor [Roseivirga sp. E12]|uniref:response regulator n=1 Tax=Roseivirga sp. E12 TaxID=2819237 RepID=UPI001ABC06D7|nr:response regulator transcription factor [Roseivirga sp. E12]MBO3700590.1 response regulator transcription factor [Roseivirga sp. E12]
MDTRISIFIVDDHPMIVDGLKGYFENSDDYEIKGSASNGLEALERLLSMEVDVILTDIQMPHMDGMELVKKIKLDRPEQKMIVLTMFNEAQYIKKMLQLGVVGYVLKNASKAELIQAINFVQEGGQYYSPEVTQVIMNKLRGNQPAMSMVTELTEREKEILYLILKQRSNQEIGEELFISTRTVEAHKRNLLEKTGSKNIAGLVIYAIDNQLFEDF